MPRRTPLPLAAAAQAMSDTGYSPADITAALALAPSTVYEILQGHGKWADLKANDMRFKDFRDRKTRELELAMIELAPVFLLQAAKVIDKASARDAAVCFGIVDDHRRLAAGLSTSNISVVTRRQSEAQDVLLARLARIASERQAQQVVVDAQIVDNGGPGKSTDGLQDVDK